MGSDRIRIRPRAVVRIAPAFRSLAEAPPRASSLVPAVNVVIVNDAGEILLIRRTDVGNWAVAGGAAGLGESVAQAVVRETLQEPGTGCAVTGIAGICSAPGHVIPCISNGEARQEFSGVHGTQATRPKAFGSLVWF
jgi:8-oxo-dGTP pyrophosphatase MutT (NUDIX family)